MTYAILCLVFLVPVDSPNTGGVRLRARAALAIAFADVQPPTYDEQRDRAAKAGQPLVVWVGQAVRPIDGCFAVRCDTFPGVESEGVVVGVPLGSALKRVDLPGRPTDAAVRAAVRHAGGL